MAATEFRKPSDQKKLLWAIALAVVALIALWWTFIGFGGSNPRPPGPTTQRNANSSVSSGTQRAQQTKPDEQVTTDLPMSVPKYGVIGGPEPGRNIFAYYEAPKPPPAQPPTPTPTPTPYVLLASVSPSNVYARTDDFKLEATGNRFSPGMRLSVDGRELPTTYINPQQLSAVVPAAIIATPGQRQIIVRDSQVFSNPLQFSVTPAPTPNYTYIGIIGKRQHIGDTAILQDKGSKDVVNVQRGDLLSGRFKVTSISDREVVLVDNNLKIKHTLQLTSEGDRGGFPQARPTPKPQSDDDEP